jgi:signal transduction histidine kinase
MNRNALSLDSTEGFCLAICHDLRGPVATAEAAVAGLARELAASPSGQSRYLQIARQSLAKAEELLGSLPGLLEIGGKLTEQSVSLEDVVARVRDDVDLDLRLTGARLLVLGALPAVRADSLRLRIALRNLIQNAIRHPRAGVPLEVRIRAWRRGTTCTLTIADNGTGFGAPIRERPGGLGIGLAIARRAVEACAGTMVAASRPGCGTSFAITLASAGAELATARRSGARASRPGSGSAPRASPAASSGRHRGPSPSRDR